MSQPVEPFSFSDQLDVAFLKEVYEDDMEYAADIFEIFLDTFDEEYGKLRELIASQKCPEIRACAHKLKPTFSMVGLTNVTEQFKALETAASNNKLDEIQQLYQKIDQILIEKIPIISDQRKQLLTHLDKSVK